MSGIQIVFRSNIQQDVYQSVMEFAKKGEKLEPQDQRFLDRVVRDFKRNGLHLAEEERNKIKDIKKKISVWLFEFTILLNQSNNFICRIYAFSSKRMLTKTMTQ